MKNLTKALVASGLLLSISGCNTQVMDCISDSVTPVSSILGIDGGATPLGIDGGATPLGIDGGAAPLGIDGGAAPLGIDGGATPLGIDGGATPSSYDTNSIDASISECLSRIQFNVRNEI